MDAKHNVAKARQRSTRSVQSSADENALLDMCVEASEHREARNGFTEAMEIINFALPKAFAKTDGQAADEVHKRIVGEIYGPMLGDDNFTEIALEKIKKGIFEQGACIDITQEVVAYCVFAVRAFLSGRESLAWSYACDARYWAGVVMTVAKKRGLPDRSATLDMLASLRTAQARAAAAEKLARDPTQTSKPLIRTEWERWQRMEVKYSGDAEFGRKMHLAHPEWVSDRSIAQLSAKWRRESKKHPAS